MQLKYFVKSLCFVILLSLIHTHMLSAMIPAGGRVRVVTRFHDNAQGVAKKTQRKSLRQYLAGARDYVRNLPIERRNRAISQVKLKAAFGAVQSGSIKDLKDALEGLSEDIIVSTQYCDVYPKSACEKILDCYLIAMSRILKDDYLASQETLKASLLERAIIRRCQDRTLARLGIVRYLLNTYAFDLNNTYFYIYPFQPHTYKKTKKSNFGGDTTGQVSAFMKNLERFGHGTFLHFATTEGEEDPALAQLLLGYGVNYTIPNIWGLLPNISPEFIRAHYRAPKTRVVAREVKTAEGEQEREE